MFRAKFQLVRAQEWLGHGLLSSLSIWSLVSEAFLRPSRLEPEPVPPLGLAKEDRQRSFFPKYKMAKFELKHLLALLILIAEVKMKQNI